MIKNGDILQWMNQPGMIWLDKTGTLTQGRLEVSQWIGDTECQAAVGRLQQESNHPVAQAILQFCETTRAQAKSSEMVADSVQHWQNGISGKINGQQWLVGNRELMNRSGVKISRKWIQRETRILDQNLSPCWVVADSEVVALVALGDRLRTDTPQAIEQLQNSGWNVGILSGDHQHIVSQVANRLAIHPEDAIGAVSPEDKVRRVQDSLNDHETVVMVGDGVNDSAALAAASVGIAVRNGAEASLAAAPVFLAESGLEPIVRLQEISRSVRRTIQANLAISVTYNCIGATFAAIGWINPLVAAILMPISSLTVVAMSMTAGRTNNQRDDK